MAKLSILLSVVICWCRWRVNSATQSAPAPTQDCSTVILSMSDCLSFVTSGSVIKKPEGGCCSGLMTVSKTSPECLCETFKNSGQLGIDLNMTKALSLPSACGVKAPSLSNCGISLAVASPRSAPAPTQDCSTVILSMSDCLSFVTSGSIIKKPEGGCCSGLTTVLKTSPECLCESFKNSGQLGIALNMTKALSLPSACGVKAPSSSNCGVSLAVASPPGVPPTPSIGLKSQHRKDGLSTGLKIIIGVLFGIGVVLLLALIVFFKWFNHSSLSIFLRRNKNKSPINIEVFLEKYGCLALQRYKYSEIKKMTNSFKDTLGQGGYGRVFKGELHDGRLVAVKQLNESKGDGEDFINEVATIGRTNHVNVVNLVGFCIEGTRRALVYEFMPNGSLERFIYTQKESSKTLPLGWETLYQIALGIARGLEYLHRGCNIRILHFDIKPHNILLDQNFCPKISDFGLAKLYPSRESIVSTVGARGTMGYIAPELYCRTFGNVSHKSDVYSYGMMMLEMIGGRKNIDATVDNISEIYFPLWIYNHLKRYNDAKGSEEIQGTEVFEDKNAKKMILVALWCIQAHPMDRPSMSKVVEMLEGNMQELQMPPNPSVDPRSSFSASL